VLQLVQKIQQFEQKVVAAEQRAKGYAAAVETFLAKFDAAFNGGDTTAIAGVLDALEALTPFHVALGGTAEVLSAIFQGVKAYEALMAQQAQPAKAAA
jgi:hypothetical protein